MGSSRALQFKSLTQRWRQIETAGRADPDFIARQETRCLHQFPGRRWARICCCAGSRQVTAPMQILSKSGGICGISVCTSAMLHSTSYSDLLVASNPHYHGSALAPARISRSKPGLKPRRGCKGRQRIQPLPNRSCDLYHPLSTSGRSAGRIQTRPAPFSGDLLAIFHVASHKAATYAPCGRSPRSLPWASARHQMVAPGSRQTAGGDGVAGGETPAKATRQRTAAAGLHGRSTAAVSRFQGRGLPH